MVIDEYYDEVDSYAAEEEDLEYLGDLNEDLLYTPVTPCKIVDTRNTSQGMIDASSVRSFYVYGADGTIGAQGGNASGCPSSLGESYAVHISVAAVDPTDKGNLKAFPYDASGTAGLTVNFASIGTNLNNAGIVKTSLGTGYFTFCPICRSPCYCPSFRILLFTTLTTIIL